MGCLTVIARPSLASLTAPSARPKSDRVHVELEEEKRMDSEIIFWHKIFAPSELPNEGKRRRSVMRTAQHGIARAEGRQVSGMSVESIRV